MPSAALIPVAGLAIAGAWQSATVLRDRRHIARTDGGSRVYRPELGWAASAALDLRARWARVGLGAASGLAVTKLAAAAGVVGSRVAVTSSIVCSVALIAWLQRDRHLHHGRYTSVCITMLAAVIALDQVAPVAAGAAASLLAAQLYAVAAIRKLRSPYFRSGRVLADTVAYGAWQAAAGSRDFLPIPAPPRMAGLLANRRFLAGCRVAAAAVVAAELTVALGAAGALPATATLALACPTHLAFTAISPRRILPFTAAALGLLTLGTTHSLLSL